jgi:PAS domain S-box-containing protein
MPFEDILADISTAPSDTIILLLTFSQEATGKNHTTPEVARRLSQVSTAPIFGILDVTLGHGIAGGSLVNFEHIGTKAGQLALDILGGTKSPGNIPATLDAPSVPMFDWQQLRHWNLNEDALPKGSIVINKEATFWDFKYYIIGGFTLCLLQSLLIVGLLLQRRRKKGAEQALKKSEDRFRMLIETMNEGLGVGNENVVWTYVNDQLCWLLGDFAGNIIGRPLTDFLDEANQSVLREQVEKQKKGDYSTYEITWTRADGRKMTTIVSPRPIFNPEGQLKEVFAVITDITERKRAEAEAFQTRSQLLRLDRLSRMGELTASLAHELNQPLAAILSNAQAGLRFLQSAKIDLDEIREILQDITQDDQRAGNVIRSLRSMVKREEVERNPVILNNVVNDVIQMLHTESIFRNVHVETELDGSLPPIMGDKVQLQQVVLNLTLNAADAMSDNPPEHRQILLGTGVKDDRVRVAVRDFGPGIDKGNLERIFEPFFSTKGAGLGMGLAVCRTIVEAHGGRIWAENNSDRGATLFFELPVVCN